MKQTHLAAQLAPRDGTIASRIECGSAAEAIRVAENLWAQTGCEAIAVTQVEGDDGRYFSTDTIGKFG